MAKFSVELDVTDMGECSEFHGERVGFLNWDTLMAEGNTLTELIESAEVTTQDQDGGEGPSVMLNDLSETKRYRFSSRIADELDRIIDKARNT